MSGVAGRTGATWERIVADHCADAGLPWDRGPLRGNHDLLDLIGTQPAGFLVGCKGIKRLKSADEWIKEQRDLGHEPRIREAYQAGQKATFGAKINEAMQQCDRALINNGHPHTRDGNGRLFVASMGIIPVQVMQRSGYPVGKSYVVTQLDYFLDLAVRRQKWRDDE